MAEALDFYIDCDKLLRFLADRNMHVNAYAFRIGQEEDARLGTSKYPKVDFKSCGERLKLDGFVISNPSEMAIMSIPDGALRISKAGKEFIMRTSYEERELQRETIKYNHAVAKFQSNIPFAKNILKVTVVIALISALASTWSAITSYHAFKLQKTESKIPVEDSTVPAN